MIVTVAVSGLVPSDTVSVKTILPLVAGAVNVGIADVGLVSITFRPEVITQEYVRLSPSGSVEPVPSRVTEAPRTTARSSPASAPGASFTVILTVSVSLLGIGSVLSDTVRVIVTLPDVGAVNVGLAVVSSVIVVPVGADQLYVISVSYTHLTLPTIYSV